VIEFVCDTSVFGSAMPRLVAQRTPGNVLGPYGYTGKFSDIKTDDLQVFYATGPILAFGGQKAKVGISVVLLHRSLIFFLLPDTLKTISFVAASSPVDEFGL
jgi:hypothetical protein